MAEYIDKDKLIDRFDELCNTICQYSKKQRAVMCSSCELGIAFDVVDDFPTEDVQPVTWIPVEERVPEEKGNYLVVFDCGYGAEVHESFFFRRDNDYGWFDPVEEYEKYNPTHWMPLPKPPEDGET